MTDRYEISAQRWAMIEAIVSPPQRIGRPRRDDRQMLNGIFWILCSGAKWRDLPERFGPWKTVYQRFRQWRDNGTFEQVLRHLHLRLRQDGLVDQLLQVKELTSAARRVTPDWTSARNIKYARCPDNCSTSKQL